MDRCHVFHWRPDGEGREADAGLESLRAGLAEARRHRFCEVRIDHAGPPSLRVLVNGDRALLLYLDDPGDPGTPSRDPAHVGDLEDDEEVEFLSDRGEWDSYPAGLTLATAEAFRALEWFAEHKRRPDFVAWCEGPGGPGVPDED